MQAINIPAELQVKFSGRHGRFGKQGSTAQGFAAFLDAFGADRGKSPCGQFMVCRADRDGENREGENRDELCNPFMGEVAAATAEAAIADPAVNRGECYEDLFAGMADSRTFGRGVGFGAGEFGTAQNAYGGFDAGFEGGAGSASEAGQSAAVSAFAANPGDGGADRLTHLPGSATGASDNAGGAARGPSAGLPGNVHATPPDAPWDASARTPAGAEKSAAGNSAAANANSGTALTGLTGAADRLGANQIGDSGASVGGLSGGTPEALGGSNGTLGGTRDLFGKTRGSSDKTDGPGALGARIDSARANASVVPGAYSAAAQAGDALYAADRALQIAQSNPSTPVEVGPAARLEPSTDMGNGNTFSFDHAGSSVFGTDGFTGASVENVRMVNLMEAVARHVQVMQQKGNGTARLQFKLEPEHLGEVTVKLVFANGKLSAQFIAASHMAREAIDQSIAQLRESLAQHNILLDEANVSTGEKENPQSQENGCAYDEFKKKTPHRDLTNRSGPGEDDAIIGESAGSYNDPVSRVNYLV